MTVYDDELVKPEVGRLAELLANPVMQNVYFQIAAALMAVLVSFLTFYTPGVKKSSRTGPATVLLVGPSDGGKTSLFAKFTQNSYPQTHTSIVPSSTTIAVLSPYGATHLNLVDIPGHPRLRDEVKKHVAETAGAVFVVDVVGIVRNAGEVAEQLPPLLTALASQAARSPMSDPPKLLLLAHKTDLLIRPTPPSSPFPPNIPDQTRTTSVERLRSILTREMDRLKSARASTSGRIEGMSKVASSSSSWWKRLFGGSTAPIGDEDEGDDEGLIWGGQGPFKWEDIDGVEVEWGCSALGMVKVGKDAMSSGKDTAVEEGDGLDDVKKFLSEI